MNIDEYLARVEPWIPGPGSLRRERLAEIRTHLSVAQSEGDLGRAIERLGEPREAARTFARPTSYRLASIPRRAAAYLTDLGLVIVTSIAVGILAAIGGAQVRRFGPFVGVQTDGPVEVALLLSGLIIWAVALVWSEWRFGRTPGKAILGIRVIHEDGTSPALGEVVLRRLPLIFSGPLQIVDWLFAFSGERRQRAFDRIARTLVVRDPEPSPGRVPNGASAGTLPSAV